MLPAALAGGMLAVGGALLLPPRSDGASGTLAGSVVDAADEPSAQGAADWCAPQFEPIPGGGCLAASSGAAHSLIVYLHGRYARAAATEELDRQSRLAGRAKARGFAVLVLRGGLGTCSAPELAEWFCWPSNEHNADAAPPFVEAWTQALVTARQRTGSRARFLLGFSNGGYFAGLIAARGLLEVDALVVAHGGPVEPVRALGSKPPLLLLSADDDVAQDEMIRFDAALARERWGHDAYARSGGHALTDEDIEVALAFFSRANEPLPLDPPLAMHRPARHVHDSGDTPPPSGPPDAPGEAVDQTEDPSSGSADDTAQDE